MVAKGNSLCGTPPKETIAERELAAPKIIKTPNLGPGGVKGRKTLSFAPPEGLRGAQN